MTVLDYTQPVARKVHICDWCGDKIMPGETYEKQAVAQDGSVYTWKTCLLCRELVSIMLKDDWYDEGVSEDDMVEWSRDHDDEPRAIAYLERRRVAYERRKR